MSGLLPGSIPQPSAVAPPAMSSVAVPASAAQPLAVPLSAEQEAKQLGLLDDKLDALWEAQTKAMNALVIGAKNDFKHHNDLPLARIKRIMKSDEDVRMISAEAPILFAKACEMFILEMAVRSGHFSEVAKHVGVEKDDILTVLRKTPSFDFLAAVVLGPEQVDWEGNAKAYHEKKASEAAAVAASGR